MAGVKRVCVGMLLCAAACASQIAATSHGGESAGYELLPRETALSGRHASQRLLVERLVDGRHAGDGTATAKFGTSDAAVVEVDDAGVVRPVGDGAATVTATVGDQTFQAAFRVEGMAAEAARSFRHDVQPVLAKLGCSTGACHGALAGKGGFKLSLRGYDPLSDFAAITRDARGRRVEPTDPGRSLLLAKPTMAVPHKGGLRFEVKSPAYEILSQWLAAGAPAPTEDDPRLEGLEVFPAGVTLRPGDKQRVLVRARYSDGRMVDVTPWAVFTSTNESAATVDEEGVVTVVGHGGGAISVWFSSLLATARITSPYDAPEAPKTDVAAAELNFIDRLVNKQLALLRLTPSPAADDATFMRRAYLDTTGVLPTAAEARAFLADGAADKRNKLIEQLLGREEFVDYWAYQWSDLMLVNGLQLEPAAVKAYYSWIRERVQENTPWDEFAREVVVARGGSVENGATNFYTLHQDPESMTENVSQAFLGLSIGCAKCHNHPLEKWTNDQYYAMANLFARVRAKSSGGEGESSERTVFVSSRGDLVQPSRGVPQPPAPLDGEAVAGDSEADRREHLAEWLTSTENPYFARAIANRVWANFFGVGLVEPVDDMRQSNPASNEELLAAAAKFVADNGYDLKALMRLILQSAAYQRSAQPAAGNGDDARNYARYYARRLSAEAALDAISQVAGTPSEFKELEQPGGDRKPTDFYKKGTRALELYDSAVASRFLKTFGRNPRMITCQCERSNEPSLVQALHIANGDTILHKLASKEGRVAALIKDGAPNYRIIEELYLSALSRYPTDHELAAELAVLDEAGEAERRVAVEDLFWAVLSSREFLFNH
jgi:hypothetical protein